MEKHFCDRCEREIKGDAEWIFGKELCEDCCEKIEYFINNPDTIISNPKYEKEKEDAEYEKIFAKGDKRAIAHFKLKHGYTLSKEDLDILKEDEVKNPCEGCTCFEAFNREDYTICPKLTHALDVINMRHGFHCYEKNKSILLSVHEFMDKGKTITPRDFEEEE